RDLAALVGPGWAQLSPTVQRRFAASRTKIFAGTGTFEATRVGRLLALPGLLFGRPLPLRTGEAQVRVNVSPEGRGDVWRRTYRFGGREETALSAKEIGRGAWLEERAGAVVMRLDVFVEGHALVFATIDFRLRLLGVDLPLPFWLTPGRMRIVHRGLAD